MIWVVNTSVIDTNVLFIMFLNFEKIDKAIVMLVHFSNYYSTEQL